MANEYAFNCPIKGEGVKLEHCESVHSTSMQGKQSQVEDKVCALAHICWMCPARNAFRVGGPWAHYDNKPHSDTPMTPAKLPGDLTAYALAHATPVESDYRRCGMWGEEVGSHDDLFAKVQKPVTFGEVSRPAASANTKRKGLKKAPLKASEKKAPETSEPKTRMNTIKDASNDMADAVTELVRKERAQAPESASEKPTAPDKGKGRKALQKSAQGASENTKPMLSMAERAKLARERKIV